MYACIHGQTIPSDVSLPEFAYGFSPLVEETAADTVVIDGSGCELLFGSAYGLANQVAENATKAKEAGGLGCKVNVALAGNPDAAICAARFFSGITFISPGEELTCLGELPIEQLKTTSISQNPETVIHVNRSGFRNPNFGQLSWETNEIEEIVETLKLWGIRTFRDFASLPVTSISERFDQVGVKLHQLANGTFNRNLRLTEAPPRFENSIELDHPISQLEPMSFLLARLLNQICANLHAYALATHELSLSLKLEDGSIHERKLSLPQPMREPRVFLRLLLLDAETHPPRAAVQAIAIKCEPARPRVQQSGLFIPLAPEPEKLELTLARLTKLVGMGNVGSPEVLDTHRPDSFRVKRFALKETKKRSGKNNTKFAIRNSQLTLGFRVYRPPLRALVQTPQGFPTELSAWGQNRSVYGKVVRVAGPWRTTGNWWRADRWSRDEWDVAIETRSISTDAETNQALYRIYRELRDGSWFVEGSYD